jgi:beta-ketodecanoyl-[acyl-carrier-protein] synthase
LNAVVIAATGVFTPEPTISNEELAVAFNAFADAYNQEHAAAIQAGERLAKKPIDPQQVEAITGVKSRHVLDKTGVLDPARMRPSFPIRTEGALSITASMGLAACEEALARAKRKARDVDVVICAASSMERPYPAIAVEIQHALGIEGFAYDLNAAGASAVFGVQQAASLIRAGQANSVLVVSPEICSAHVDWRDRDSCCLFGDAASAVLVEAAAIAPPGSWAILGAVLKTRYSDAIRWDAGFLGGSSNLLAQDARKVQKELAPFVSDMVLGHLAELHLEAKQLRRLWLSQLSVSVTKAVAQGVLGREPNADECPLLLETYANISSAGAIAAFHKTSGDLGAGERGLICAFGAGYAASAIFLAKAA